MISIGYMNYLTLYVNDQHGLPLHYHDFDSSCISVFVDSHAVEAIPSLDPEYPIYFPLMQEVITGRDIEITVNCVDSFSQEPYVFTQFLPQTSSYLIE